MPEEYHRSHGSQFTPRRLIVLSLLFVGVFLWMNWMRVAYPPHKGGKPPRVPTQEEWNQYWWLAIACIALVVVVVLATVLIERRVEKVLPEEEKDWHGPDPHVDRKIPVESYSPSPIMRAAIRRTLAGQEKRAPTGAPQGP
jgi:hypothetical protein